MNRRKAGEDFYFMNKLMAVGGVSENTSTRILPGVRASRRTPFGTGRALHDAMSAERESWQTYDTRVFRDLAALVSKVDTFYARTPGDWSMDESLSETMRSFLLEQGMTEKQAEIHANCAGPESFRKRFFQWFDAFRALKFIHYATRHAYPRQALEPACRELLAWQGLEGELPGTSATQLLMYFRARDRGRSGTVRVPVDGAATAVLDTPLVPVRLLSD
jgi:hypothetical protein